MREYDDFDDRDGQKVPHRQVRARAAELGS